MELDITDFFYNAVPRKYSGSVAELGYNAGRITWAEAHKASSEYNILDTEEKREAFREFVRESGGWTWEEIRAWTDTELNALCIQWIAGDMREMGIDTPGTDIDWERTQDEQEKGQCPSNIGIGVDGTKVYFSLS